MTEETKKAEDTDGAAPKEQPNELSPAAAASPTALETSEQDSPTSRKHNEEPSGDSVAFDPSDWRDSSIEVEREKQGKHRLAEGQKTRPVFFYIGVMFFVALALLLLSFFMQQRNHEAVLQGLSESAVSVQNLQSLEKERDELSSKLDTLEPQLKELQDEVRRLEEELEATKAELQDARGATASPEPPAP